MSIPDPNELDAFTPIRWDDYCEELRQLITAAVYAQFEQYNNGGWEENQITTAIATALVSNGRQVLDDDEKLVTVNWRAQRFRGDAEYERGDLGIAVHFTFPNNKRLTGYAHLEAKVFKYQAQSRGSRAIDLYKGAFLKLQREQLLTHLEHTHAHYVLLYDVRPNSDQNTTDRIEVEPLAETLISEHVIALASRKRGMYRNTEPCSDLIAKRLLHGYGLDYRTPPEHVVKMWDPATPGGVVLHGDVAVSDGESWPDPHKATTSSGSGGGSAIALEDALAKVGLDEFIRKTGAPAAAVAIEAADVHPEHQSDDDEGTMFMTHSD